MIRQRVSTGTGALSRGANRNRQRQQCHHRRHRLHVELNDPDRDAVMPAEVASATSALSGSRPGSGGCHSSAAVRSTGPKRPEAPWPKGSRRWSGISW